MSNNNQYWGKKFGSYSPFVPKGLKEPRGNIFTVRNFPSSNGGNSGKKVNRASTKQSIHDKKLHEERVKLGAIPVIIVRFKQYA